MLINDLRARRGAARLALAAAAVLSLSACGGGGGDPLKNAGAVPTPTKQSTKPTPSTTPTTLPPPPAVALQHTDDGAVAFVKYYFETLVNNAYQTGNVALVALVSDPNCVVCRASIGDIAYFAATGTHAQGGKVSASGVKIGQSAPDLTTVNLTYSVDKLLQINRDGSTAFDTPAVTQDIVAQVQWNSGSSAWRMRQIVYKAPSAPTASPTATP